MIKVKLTGHIRTSVGAEEIELAETEVDVSLLVDKVRAMSRQKDPGFNRFNTIALVEEGEAFVPAGEKRTLRDGQRVVLIPFSHGG